MISNVINLDRSSCGSAVRQQVGDWKSGEGDGGTDRPLPGGVGVAAAQGRSTPTATRSLPDLQPVTVLKWVFRLSRCEYGGSDRRPPS
jgi:hypothetical protein